MQSLWLRMLLFGTVAELRDAKLVCFEWRGIHPQHNLNI